MNRKKNILLSIIAVVMSLVVLLVSGEVMVRLFTEPHVIPPPPAPRSFNPYRPNTFIINMQPYLYFYIPHSRYTQKLRLYDNEYSINGMGFRGSEFKKKTNGIKRLAVIGDSVVEGHGVQPEQTFSYHLGEKLADSDWETINLGMQGASPIYYAANLERYLHLQPDAVLLLIYENDLREDDNRERDYFKLPVLEEPQVLYSGDTLHPWYAKSRLISFLHTAMQAAVRSPLEKIIEKNGEILAETDKNSAARTSKKSYTFSNSTIDQRWQMSQKYLTYFLENLRSRDIDLLISSLCTVTLVYPDKERYGEYCSNLESRVKQWAGHHNVPYLSLVDPMKKALAGRPQNDILIYQDMHPTPLTHQVLADHLYPFVRKQLTGKTGSRRAAE